MAKQAGGLYAQRELWSASRLRSNRISLEEPTIQGEHQIEHLSFDWINTTERVYGAKAGEYQQVCLHIGLLNNQKIDIRVTEKPSFMGMSSLLD